MWIGCSNLPNELKTFWGVIWRRSILLPLLLTFLLESTPSYKDAGYFVLASQARWTSFDLSVFNLIYGLLYFFLTTWVIARFKALPLKYVQLGAGILWTITGLLYFSLIFAREIPFLAQMSIQIFQMLIFRLAETLPLIVIIGNFTKKCPKTFETTGVSLLGNFNSSSVFSSGLLTSQMLKVFNVRDGHYDNLVIPIYINCFYCICLVGLSPLFSVWEEREIAREEGKRRSLEIGSKVEVEGKNY